jgi:cytochrome oxidase Cu insertion factor (SCO1/SenC/PrrC family)/thiol-disulfide isomerase/thioredoxin
VTRRFLFRYYAAVTAALVAGAGLFFWLHTRPDAPAQATVIVLASARTPQVMAPAEVRLHAGGGWQRLSARPPANVPIAPDTLVLAQAGVRPGNYDMLEVGGARLPLSLNLGAGQVQPLLVEVAGGRPNPAGLYVGGQEVNLGLNELGGKYLFLPPFRLVDQNGQSFDNAGLAGRDVVVAAFHTECHTTCPLYTGLFLQLQQRLPASTVLLEVTTDPVRDTPQVLRAYAASLDARWTFLTGETEAVAAFWKTFGVQLSDGEAHSSTLALVDRHGFLRQVYQGVPRLDQPLAEPLRAGLNAQGREQLASRGDGWGAPQVLDVLRTMGTQLERSAAAGGSAPEFATVDLGGRPISLAEYRGRPLVLNFWASWCGPCRKEMPLLQRAADAHPGLAFLLVNERDDAGRARAFAGELRVTLRSAVDADGRVAAAYKVGQALPATIFVAADGTIQGRYLGELDEATLMSHVRALGS